MDRRLDLDDKLHADFDGIAHIYFQPPESVKMIYPAIRYKRSSAYMMHADNIPYLHDIAYEVTVIDRNPDSEVTKKFFWYSKCRFNRSYVSDNLYHDVFILYY